MRARLVADTRGFIASLEARGVSAGHWNALGARLAALEAGDVVELADWEVPGEHRPHPLRWAYSGVSWYRLEPDDSLTPSESLFALGALADVFD